MYIYSGFSVHPGNNWVLEVNKDYTVTVNIFDKNNRKIYIAEVSFVYNNWLCYDLHYMYAMYMYLHSMLLLFFQKTYM